jgi:hypothetical protein
LCVCRAIDCSSGFRWYQAGNKVQQQQRPRHDSPSALSTTRICYHYDLLITQEWKHRCLR